MALETDNRIIPAAAKTGVDEEERGGWWERISPSRLTSRIVLINLVGLVILLAGFFYSNQLRESLIDARVQGLMAQAKIMAAAVQSSASVDTGEIVVDAEKLLKQQEGEDAGSPFDAYRSFRFLIKPEQAGPVLRRLARSTRTHARIYDRNGALSVDTRYYYRRGDILRLDLEPVGEEPKSWLAKKWEQFSAWLLDTGYPRQKEYGLDNGKDLPEVTAALNGAEVSVVRVNAKNEIIVSVAVPVQRYRAILGALVVSNRGGEIDDVVKRERRIVISSFVFATLVAVLLSLLLAGHIAEPIRRLAAAAERVRRGVNNRVEIPDFTSRSDEIGHLSGALRDMTEALYRRIDAIEAFAADVAHELKNPLTSLRSAVETIGYAKSEEQRNRLIEIVNQDVRRLDRLISDISDASRLDAELARAQARPVDVRELVETITTIANETRRDDDPVVEVEIADPPAGLDVDRAYWVMGHDTRLGQVLQNLINNARSFSPPGGRIDVRLRRTRHSVELRVEDQGPGINPDNLEKIFTRFYTDRPQGSFGENSGLGLSISKQIVDAHGGRIFAANRDQAGASGESGARFVVVLPALDKRRKAKRG